MHDDISRTGGEIAWAIRKDSPQLKARLDDFAKRNKKKVLDRQPAPDALPEEYEVREERHIRGSSARSSLALVQYFQKYGDKYDVDWVLMGAQGYQESQLNQNAKSAVGAVGVMQVMPPPARI